MTTLAAIDIGSNAMRSIIAKVPLHGNVKVISSHRESVRLGTDVFRKGMISEHNMQRTLAAMMKFKKLVKDAKAKDIAAVATSAVREAKNGAVLIERIASTTGINVNAIEGLEEARLISKAIERAIPVTRKTSLLVDIGGGSVETSLLVGGHVLVADSVKMGTVRLLQMMKSRRTAPKIFNRLVQQYAKEIKRRVKREVASRGVRQLIGTGGSIECFGELRSSLFGKSQSNRVKKSELDAIMEILRGLTTTERITKLGLKPDRADVIIPAGLLLQAVMQESGSSQILIPKVGLKDGVLLDLAERLSKKKSRATTKNRKQQLFNFAHELAIKYRLDWKHSEHVAKLATLLFKQTRKLHKLPASDELLLQVAALLHDIGSFVDEADHHKHSYYILRETPLIDLSKEEKGVVAAIARYHRGSFPKAEHESFKNLNESEKKKVRYLSSILRIAEALDKEHSKRVQSVRLTIRGKKLILKLKGHGEMALERWAVEEAKHYFELVTHKKLGIG